MEKTSKTILSLIISFVITYSLIVPTSHIFGLEDSSAVNGSIDPSGPSQSSSNTEQTSKASAQDSETTGISEPQKADDANSEKGSSEQSGQTVRASSSTHNTDSTHTIDSNHKTRLSKQSEQTVKASSSTDNAPPGRIGTITVKVVSDNQIDLKWTGVKDSDLNHYNIYRGTKSSFKVSSGETMPTGTSTTNSYSLTGLKPSTKYYVKIARSR